MIIKGRDSTADMAGGWKIAIVARRAAACCSPSSRSLQAQLPTRDTPRDQDPAEIREAHGTLAAYQVYLAVRAARRLRVAIGFSGCRDGAADHGHRRRRARRTNSSPQPGACKTAVTDTRSAACGAPLPGPPGELRLAVPGATAPAAMPFSQISALSLAAACP